MFILSGRGKGSRWVGDVQSDHHLVFGKVRVKHGRFPITQEGVRSIMMFESLND